MPSSAFSLFTVFQASRLAAGYKLVGSVLVNGHRLRDCEDNCGGSGSARVQAALFAMQGGVEVGGFFPSFGKPELGVHDTVLATYRAVVLALVVARHPAAANPHTRLAGGEGGTYGGAGSCRRRLVEGALLYLATDLPCWRRHFRLAAALHYARRGLAGACHARV